jgi:hypothetical protein
MTLVTGDRLLRVSAIEHEQLMALISDEEPLVAIRGTLLDRDQALRIAHRLLAAPFKPYGVEPGFQYWGLPLFEARGEAARATYHDQAAEVSRRIRAATAPDAPLLQLRELVLDAWPAGLRKLRLGGRRCTDAIVRELRAGGRVEPHVDDPWFDSAFHPDAASIATTLSGVLYFETPPVGGTVRLWPRRLTREEERACRRAGSAYGLDEQLIGPPAVLITPEPGEFVFFVASRPHAIDGFEHGRRLTLSCFLNYHGPNEPLSIHA